jgi:TRAP-type C4-dicarboxylate transport system permease small subunit
MKIIRNVINKITTVLGLVAGIGTAAGAFLTFIDIMMRFIFKHSIVGTYEIMQMTFLCAALAAYSYTQAQKGHINVVFVLKMLPSKVRMVIYAITSLVSTVLCTVLTRAVFMQTISYYNHDYVTPTALIPIWPFCGGSVLL